jgi:hypothetical protein
MTYYSPNPYHSQRKPKSSDCNNTVQNVTSPQGYYVGSASNITRLFILVIFLFTIIISCISFYYGKELGRLEQKIDSSRIIPCVSGGSYERVSKRT